MQWSKSRLGPPTRVDGPLCLGLQQSHHPAVRQEIVTQPARPPRGNPWHRDAASSTPSPPACCCCLCHACQCSGLAPISVLREHSQWSSGDSRQCQEPLLPATLPPQETVPNSVWNGPGSRHQIRVRLSKQCLTRLSKRKRAKET